MSNYREYIASTVIYKSDIEDIIEAQRTLKNYANGLTTYAVLNTAMSVLTSIALGQFSKIGKTAAAIAFGLSEVLDVSLSLPSERAAVLALIEQGIGRLYAVKAQFTHESMEAVRLDMPYWEDLDEDVRFISGKGGNITSVLINGVWHD